MSRRLADAPCGVNEARLRAVCPHQLTPICGRQRLNGSVAAWRERRKLLSRSAPNQAVGIYAVTRAVPSVMNLAHIEASHLAAGLTLTTAEQERGLEEAEARHWTPAQLRDAVRTQRRVQGERRGRPRATEQERAHGIEARRRP